MVEVVVARIGKPHGIKGEVTVEVRTDSPDRRLAPGVVVTTRPKRVDQLEIKSRRVHNGTTLLGFVDVPDRNAAEELRNLLLVADAQASDENDAWHPHELVGLAAVNMTGESLGTVSDLVMGPGQDRLEVTTANDEQVLVPFVHELVPEVDLDGGVVRIDAPVGLFPEPGQEDL